MIRDREHATRSLSALTPQARWKVSTAVNSKYTPPTAAVLYGHIVGGDGRKRGNTGILQNYTTQMTQEKRSVSVTAPLFVLSLHNNLQQ